MPDYTGQEILKLWKEARVRFSKFTQKQHAQELGIDFKSYRGKIYRAQLNEKYSYEINEEFTGYDKPGLYDWQLPEVMKLTLDNFMVIGDVQLPTTDYDFAMLPALVAQKHLKSPRHLIIAGDFWNMDAFSKYPKIIPLPDYKTEQEAARNLLAIYSKTFDEIYMICGNHERRRLAQMNGEDSFTDIVNTILPNGRIRASVLDRMEVTTSQGLVNVLHGGTYAKKALSAVDELAQKYQSHIIGHHEHHAAEGMDRYDRYYIINNGGLFDTQKMAYVNLASTTMAGMSKGFTIVKDGYPHLLREKYTDWNMWL